MRLSTEYKATFFLYGFILALVIAFVIYNSLGQEKIETSNGDAMLFDIWTPEDVKIGRCMNDYGQVSYEMIEMNGFQDEESCEYSYVWVEEDHRWGCTHEMELMTFDYIPDWLFMLKEVKLDYCESRKSEYVEMFGGVPDYSC